MDSLNTNLWFLIYDHLSLRDLFAMCSISPKFAQEIKLYLRPKTIGYINYCLVISHNKERFFHSCISGEVRAYFTSDDEIE